jgi:hypothetical protein
MPLVQITEPTVTSIGDGVLAVDVVFKDLHAIPTRTAQAAKQKIGAPDAFSIAGKDVEVLAGGFRSDIWHPERIELAEHAPARLVRERGIPSRGEVRVRWFVRGKGDRATVTWQGEKARDQSLEIRLR